VEVNAVADLQAIAAINPVLQANMDSKDITSILNGCMACGCSAAVVEVAPCLRMSLPICVAHSTATSKG
jgi:hypothetical protein